MHLFPLIPRLGGPRAAAELHFLPHCFRTWGVCASLLRSQGELGMPASCEVFLSLPANPFGSGAPELMGQGLHLPSPSLSCSPALGAWVAVKHPNSPRAVQWGRSQPWGCTPKQILWWDKPQRWLEPSLCGHTAWCVPTSPSSSLGHVEIQRECHCSYHGKSMRGITNPAELHPPAAPGPTLTAWIPTPALAQRWPRADRVGIWGGRDAREALSSATNHAWISLPLWDY